VPHDDGVTPPFAQVGQHLTVGRARLAAIRADVVVDIFVADDPTSALRFLAAVRELTQHTEAVALTILGDPRVDGDRLRHGGDFNE
jgi:hypothetical protein